MFGIDLWLQTKGTLFVKIGVAHNSGTKGVIELSNVDILCGIMCVF